MYGVDEDDPYCIHTVDQLIEYINEIGFLPLFKNEIPGFSVEERTVSLYWWSGIQEKDPWEWREIIAHSGKVAYGKFFLQRSKSWQASVKMAKKILKVRSQTCRCVYTWLCVISEENEIKQVLNMAGLLRCIVPLNRFGVMI